MDTSRAWAEVDLDAFESNLKFLRQRLRAGVAMLLVAKANAYGHGAVALAHRAISCGVDGLAVTTSAEAMELRSSGIRARIIVLGPILGNEAAEALQNQIEFGVHQTEHCRAVEEIALATGSSARVHVKIDTGMGRLGTHPPDALPIFERIKRSPALELAGVMTHIAATDGALSAQAGLQLAAFDGLLMELRKARLMEGRNVWIHASNSAAVLSGMESKYDAVRIGIAAYGIAPHPSLEHGELTPVISIRTRIAHLNQLPLGASVGYGGTWTARRPSRIAVLPLGYDDGLSWRLSNKGHVLVRGQRAPIVGRVSMDYTTVDVTDIPDAILGDRVTVLGSDGGLSVRVEEMAEQIGTIPYEITCSIGKRVGRIYLGSERGSLIPFQAARPVLH